MRILIKRHPDINEHKEPGGSKAKFTKEVPKVNF